MGLLRRAKRDTAVSLPGGWTCTRLLAQGSFARVYEGMSKAGEPVAIKVPAVRDERALRLFEREIKVLEQLLPSPHIAGYRGHGRLTDGRPFLALELVQGFTLEKMLTTERRLPETAACELIIQLCEALATMHSLGLSHGDVKPSNVMLTSDTYEVKLLDFGMVRDAHGMFRALESRYAIPGDAFDEEHDVGILAGTPEYAAPEQIDDAWTTSTTQLKRGPAADVYAVGVIAFRLLTGRRLWPFEPTATSQREYEKQARAWLDARRQLEVSASDRPPEISAPVWDVLIAALARRPEDRPADATALMERLETLLSPGGSIYLETAPTEPELPMITGTLRPVVDEPAEPPPRRAPLAGSLLIGVTAAAALLLLI